MGLAATRRTSVATAALAFLPLAGVTLLLAATATAQNQENSVQATADNKFLPDTITVPVGGTVTWTAPSGTFHTVTGGKDGQKDPSSPMQGPLGFTTYTVAFDKAGTFPYFCEPHVSLGMVGTVVVGGAGGSATPTAGASSQPSPSASPTPVGSPVASPGEGGETGHGVPGVEGNEVLERIEAERAAQKGTIGGFRAFTAAGSAALLALGVAVFASTRTRRRES